MLLLGQSALGSQRLAPLGKLWEADHLRLVSLDQAAIGALDRGSGIRGAPRVIGVQTLTGRAGPEEAGRAYTILADACLGAGRCQQHRS